MTEGSVLLEAARRLAPFFDERAERNEAERVLGDDVLDVLRGEGFLGIWVPRSLGGSELGPLDSLALLEEVSRADASTGWVLMASALAIGTGAAYLGDAAVDELYGDGRLPVIAGQGAAPNGRATPERDGFRLRGHWSYGSGIMHADHLHSAAIVEEDGAPRLGPDGAPEVRIFVTPREVAAYGDNWDVLGLRATASIDYAIESAFVPAAYTHVAGTESPTHGGNVYTMGIPGFATICHSAWALGVGRRMLDELVGYVRARSTRPGGLASNDGFLEALARAEASYRAARALVYEAWRDAGATLAGGGALSTRQRTMTWLALNQATWSIADVCRFAYSSAGGVALRRGTIQRLFRDMHAGTQHITSSAPILQRCGRELAGLAEGARWVGIGQLVTPP